MRASTLSPEQLEHLCTLPQHAAMSRLANAVPAGMLFTVYACIVDQLSLRDNDLGAHVFNISGHPDDEQFACCQTLGDSVLDADFLPESVYRLTKLICSRLKVYNWVRLTPTQNCLTSLSH